MSFAPPSRLPPISTKSRVEPFFPMRPAGLALLSQQLMEYSDHLRDAKVYLLASEDLQRNIDKDLKSKQALEVPQKVMEFIRAKEEQLKAKNSASDEAAGRVRSRLQQQAETAAATAAAAAAAVEGIRPSTSMTQSTTSSNIYAATNNNPYTLGLHQRNNSTAQQQLGNNNPYALHNNRANYQNQYLGSSNYQNQYQNQVPDGTNAAYPYHQQQDFSQYQDPALYSSAAASYPYPADPGQYYWS